MADYRQIHTKIWNDEWFLDLDSQEKLLFIYLFSNPRACLAGIYDIPLRVIAFDTALDLAVIAEALKKFESKGKVFYDNGWVFIPKLVKYNAGNIASPKVKANLRVTIDAVKDNRLKQLWIRHYGSLIGYQYSINTQSEIEKEQEQEQEQEQKQEQEQTNGANAPATLSPSSLPSSYPEWLELLKQNKNKQSTLAFMYRTLYKQEGEKSDFARLGDLARKAGSASALASILWNNASRALVDPLSYITAIVNSPRGHKNNGRDPAPLAEAVPEGHYTHPDEEFAMPAKGGK